MFLFTKDVILNASLHSPTNKRKSEEISKSGGDKYGYLKDIHTKHKIKKQKTDIDEIEGTTDGNIFKFAL